MPLGATIVFQCPHSCHGPWACGDARPSAVAARGTAQTVVSSAAFFMSLAERREWGTG